MSKEDNRKRSERAHYLDPDHSPRHFPRASRPDDPKTFAAAKPVIYEEPKGLALTAHTLLHASSSDHFSTIARRIGLAFIQESRGGVNIIGPFLDAVH